MWTVVLGCAVATAAPAPQEQMGWRIVKEGNLLSDSHLIFAEDYFQKFMFFFQKSYKTPEEQERRFEIFKRNMLQKNKGNRPNVLDFYGINQFSDLTHQEYLDYLVGSTTALPPLQIFQDIPMFPSGLRNAPKMYYQPNSQGSNPNSAYPRAQGPNSQGPNPNSFYPRAQGANSQGSNPNSVYARAQGYTPQTWYKLPDVPNLEELANLPALQNSPALQKSHQFQNWQNLMKKTQNELQQFRFDVLPGEN